MLHISSKYKGHAEHEHYKHMKLETKVWALDLKACSACDEQEHAMHLAE